VPLIAALATALPEAILGWRLDGPGVAATHLGLAAAPRRYCQRFTGYGTLGYGLPAAIGAQLASGTAGDRTGRRRAVMFTRRNSPTAWKKRLPVSFWLWHNAGYEEIRAHGCHGVEHLCVDLKAPDFLTLARGFGCRRLAVDSPTSLKCCLASRPLDGPMLIEVDATVGKRSLATPHDGYPHDRIRHALLDQQFIKQPMGGQPRQRRLAVTDPFRESVIARSPQATRRRGCRSGSRPAARCQPAARLSGTRRADYLDGFADALTKRREALIRLSSINNGKAIAEAAIDLDDAIACYRYYAGQARALDARQANPSHWK